MIDLTNKPVRTGEKVVLRPFKEEDFIRLEEILTEKEVITLTGSDDHFDREEVYEWYKTRNDQSNRLDLAIVDKATNQIVGEVVLNEYNEENHSMNFRILIGHEGRNRGFGTEATQLLCQYIFNQTNLKALTLTVFSFNPRAKHMYEKVGFIETSLDKNDIEYEGQMMDSIHMMLTRDRFIEGMEAKK